MCKLYKIMIVALGCCVLSACAGDPVSRGNAPTIGAQSGDRVAHASFGRYTVTGRRMNAQTGDLTRIAFSYYDNVARAPVRNMPFSQRAEMAKLALNEYGVCKWANFDPALGQQSETAPALVTTKGGTLYADANCG